MKTLLLFLLLVVFSGCDSPVADPLICDGGIERLGQTFGTRSERGLGRCYHTGNTPSELFQWSEGATTHPIIHPPSHVERKGKFMERLEQLIDQIGDLFQRWLKDFDEKPWRTGAKILVGIIVIRFAYRMLARAK